MLQHKNGTTYSSYQNELESYGVNISDQPIVVDHNIITSCGPSTATEVAFVLLEKVTNKVYFDIDSEVDMIEFSMDAADPETYAKLRPPISGKDSRSNQKRWDDQVNNIKNAVLILHCSASG